MTDLAARERAALRGASGREGEILVNGSPVRVSQRAPCRFDLGASTSSVNAGGGERTINVVVASECAWTATTDVEWISLTPPVTGSGNGTVRFAVAPNPGATRIGSVSIGNQRLVITQLGASAPAPAAELSM